jgi:four helix bundle protein
LTGLNSSWIIVGMYTYQKLKVFHSLRYFIREVYNSVTSFPPTEKHNLSSQLRRAAVSSLCNLVEGLSRRSSKEKLRFIEISYGSLLECNVLLLIALDMNYISEQEHAKLETTINECTKMLSGLRKSLTNK